MKLNKTDFVNEMHDRLGYTKKDAAAILDDVLQLILDEMSEGNEMSFRGFGDFVIAAQAPRRVRNLQTGEMIDVPEKSVPKFHPGNHMRFAVNKWEASRTGGAK